METFKLKSLSVWSKCLVLGSVHIERVTLCLCLQFTHRCRHSYSLNWVSNPFHFNQKLRQKCSHKVNHDVGWSIWMNINKMGLILNWVRNFASVSASYWQMQTQSYSLNVNGPLDWRRFNKLTEMSGWMPKYSAAQIICTKKCENLCELSRMFELSTHWSHWSQWEAYNCANNYFVNYLGCTNKWRLNYPGCTVFGMEVIIVI